MNDSENPILNECSICLKENLDEDKCVTNCSHIFCKECLDQWFDQGKSSCPLCRRVVQYFNHQSSQIRIVNTQVNSRTVIPRSQYQQLIHRNLQLKFSLFVASLGIILSSVLYISDSFNLNYYINRLYECEYNNTRLNQQLDNYQLISNNQENPPYILVTLFQDNIYQKCYIPLSSYMKCFNF